MTSRKERRDGARNAQLAIIVVQNALLPTMHMNNMDGDAEIIKRVSRWSAVLLGVSFSRSCSARISGAVVVARITVAPNMRNAKD